ncbi:6-carboxyhexanoate--CoA ligase [Alkalihalobacillus deserti]|uniref:6-carboxyhexanoate--CoA ligase n=1 Tax=Alkalihalobacillus deserti TaxID=2879466 RepID=UPI001D14EE71|nr:6-carboxyhexanoate--CoA ligase [Alkalihalobacillus deserti]
MQDKFFSVRMRAAKDASHEKGGKHISGGEMLATYENIKKAMNTLMDKALSHARGAPDFMQIQFEEVDKPFHLLAPLHIKTNTVSNADEGHEVAINLLKKCGVPKQTIDMAYDVISQNDGMRGAILIDAHSGERVDNRGKKGIRVSRMDWFDETFEKWATRQNMPVHFRVKEAVTLATKVANHPDTIAELCWSDDPDYVTGYVASKELGYQRISNLKEYGDERGCRIFFVGRSENIETYIDYLEKEPILLEWEEENDTRIN